MSLCKSCIEQGRSTCAAQEMWDRGEQKLQAAIRSIENDWRLRDHDPALKAAHDNAIEELLQSRERGSVAFYNEAKKLGCRNLKMLPFAR